MKMKHYLKAILVALIPLISHNSFAQLEGYVEMGKELKEKKRQNKMRKSEASFELLSMERNIEYMNTLCEKTDFKLHEYYYDDFVLRVDSMHTNLEGIKTKDKKWDTEEYEVSMAKFDERLAILKPQREKMIQKNAIYDKIAAKYDIYRHQRPDKEYEDRKRFELDQTAEGREFYEYYVNTLKVAEIHDLFQEYFAIETEFSALLKGRGLTQYDERVSGMKKDFYDEYDDWANSFLNNAQKTISKINSSGNPASSAFEFKHELAYQKYMVMALRDFDSERKTEAGEVIKSIEEAEKKLQEATLKANMISPDRVGKVLFTKVDVSRKDFESTEKITKWEIGNNLCYRFFFEKTPIEYAQELGEVSPISHNACNVFAHIYLDGEKIKTYRTVEFTGQWDLFKNAFTLRQEIELERIIADHIMNLNPGTHTIKIENVLGWDGYSKYSSVMSTGEIEFDFNESAKAKLKNNEDVCLNKSKMNNSALVSRFKKVIEEGKSTGDSYLNETDEIKFVRIIEADWRIQHKQYTGIITGRSIDVMIAGKDKDGNCFKQIVGMNEDYEGGGNYGNLKVKGTTARETISCLCF